MHPTGIQGRVAARTALDVPPRRRQRRPTRKPAGHSAGQWINERSATHLLVGRYAIRMLQRLVGQQDARATMIYAQVLNQADRELRNPADALVRDPSEYSVETAYHQII